MTLRVVVLGGTGNFGARIVRALRGDPAIEVVAASRGAGSVAGLSGVRPVALDAFAADVSVRLRELAPDLVIHTVGPFQGQGYGVAEAALAVGAHYLDLADGRAFVCGFAPANHARAVKAGRVAISGASTLPALSAAVIAELRRPLKMLETVEIAIAPGQRAVRGAATLAAVFSYLGRPIQVWRGGQWETRFGWMDIQRVPLSFGSRWGALCEVPDLTLLPEHFPDLQSVSFHAALEFRLQHLVLWKLAALRRLGLPFAVDRWAQALNRVSGAFDPFAGPWGGMRVSVVGEHRQGRRVQRVWELMASAVDGPEIPCMAAVLLARRLAGGENFQPGASACVGFLANSEFESEFVKWGIRTRIDEAAA